MYRAIPTVNKHLQRKQDQRNRTIHLQHLKNIKPFELPDDMPIINNKKKQHALSNKYNQIDRQNQILLEKITGIFRKKNYHSINREKQVISRSLNNTQRRKQIEDIEMSNIKMVKRLNDRKSQYQVEKMRKQWRRQKQVIKNIANFPLTIFKKRKQSQTAVPNERQQKLFNLTTKNQKKEKPFELEKVYQMHKTQLIDHFTFDIIIRLDKISLKIIGQTALRKEKKVIELERGEALEFLRNECENDLENIFKKLKFDGDSLYLFSQNLEQEHTPQETKIPQENRVVEIEKFENDQFQNHQINAQGPDIEEQVRLIDHYYNNEAPSSSKQK